MKETCVQASCAPACSHAGTPVSRHIGQPAVHVSEAGGLPAQAGTDYKASLFLVSQSSVAMINFSSTFRDETAST